MRYDDVMCGSEVSVLKLFGVIAALQKRYRFTVTITASYSYSLIVHLSFIYMVVVNSVHLIACSYEN